MTIKPEPLYMPPARRAYVAFTRKTDQKWLRFFLRDDFQHCSVHIQDAQGWTSIENLAGYIECFHHEVDAGFDLPAMLRGQGMIVFETPLRRDDKTKKMLAPAFCSCVEIVKRVLGMRKPLVITPRQLYKNILKQNEASA